VRKCRAKYERIHHLIFFRISELPNPDFGADFRYPDLQNFIFFLHQIMNRMKIIRDFSFSGAEAWGPTGDLPHSA
jgi:hypothetical protein